jgi:hypothetical protein
MRLLYENVHRRSSRESRQSEGAGTYRTRVLAQQEKKAAGSDLITPRWMQVAARRTDYRTRVR